MDFVPRQPVPETAPVIARIPEVPFTGLETLWLQVGGTLCNLSCNHCFISCHPENYNIPMMTLGKVRTHLEAAKTHGVRDIYITGGEVFLNPQIMEILEAILEYGPCHALTNGTTLNKKRVAQLKEIQSRSRHPLHFRVSLDSLDEKENDSVRGESSFHQATEGIRNLSAAGFPTHLTLVRSWDEEDDPIMEKKALQFLSDLGAPDGQAKFLPGFLMGELEKTAREYHENERVTEACFENWPITNLQCSSSRMATEDGVYVCPILVEEPSAKMGATLDDTLKPYPLSHAACYTCRISGMSCES